MSISVAINGFGRIGRQLTRLIHTHKHPNIRLTAINTLEPLSTAAHLLRYDSSYGPLPLSVTTAPGKLIVNGTPITWHNESDPNCLDWAKEGVDIVIESSGANALQGAERHLAVGAKKVLITAASSTPDITLCMGVNQDQYNPLSHHIISGSSCTTNCIAPVAKLLLDAYGIKAGMVSIVHSYTNTQNLLDAVHSDPRRSRSATQSIIPAQTSAVRQVQEIIPQLRNKISGLALRVPTPLMHLADLSFLLEKSVRRTELIELFEKASQTSLPNILSINREPLVSTDFKGSSHSSIIDLEYLYANDNLVKLLLWHDNEYSYCCRIIDLLLHIGSFL